MKLKILAVLISSVVFSNVALADKYTYNKEINLAVLEGDFLSAKGAFDKEKVIFKGKQGEEPASYLVAEFNFAKAQVAYEQGKELFKAFLSLVTSLNFAKAQNRQKAIDAIKTALINNYLTAATANEDIEL